MANYDAYGTKLKRGGTAGTAVAQVTNISGPGISVDTYDVTSHDSTGKWREFVSGLKDGGEISLDLNFDPAGATQKAAAGGLLFDMTAGTSTSYALVFSDSATTSWTFSAFVTAFEPAAPHDGKLSATCTLKITANPTLA